MQRSLEPELMVDPAQVAAYAEADFEQPHNDFIQRLQAFVSGQVDEGYALDLGCGPGDITRRFALAFPMMNIDAVDGSTAMLDYAKKTTAPDLANRITYIQGKLPHCTLARRFYHIIYSNSLLHHLPDPDILWGTIKKHSKPSTYVVVMDLLRPDSPAKAQTLVEQYANNEPEILRQDFYNSLLAAFTLPEVKEQLSSNDLPLTAEQISDRHVFISGIMC